MVLVTGGVGCGSVVGDGGVGCCVDEDESKCGGTLEDEEDEGAGGGPGRGIG